MSNRIDDSSTSPDVDDQGLFPVPPIWFAYTLFFLILIWSAYLLYETMGYVEFEDYALPMLLLPLLVLLVVMKLVMITFPDKVDRLRPNPESSDSVKEVKEKTDDPLEQQTKPKAEKERDEIKITAWIIALPIMMYVIGMGWTVLLYMFGFIWHYLQDAKYAIAMTAGLFMFMTILFVYVLNMIIWTGILGLPDPIRFVTAQIDGVRYILGN